MVRACEFWESRFKTNVDNRHDLRPRILHRGSRTKHERKITPYWGQFEPSDKDKAQLLDCQPGERPKNVSHRWLSKTLHSGGSMNAKSHITTFKMTSYKRLSGSQTIASNNAQCMHEIVFFSREVSTVKGVLDRRFESGFQNKPWAAVRGNHANSWESLSIAMIFPNPATTPYWGQIG